MIKSMNILQKIIDTPEEPASIDPSRLAACFAPLQLKVRLCLETSAPSLIWRDSVIEAVALKTTDLQKTYQSSALFYGLGKSDTQIEALITVDAEIAYVASSFALIGPDVPDVEDLAKLPLSQLDLLLLADLIDEVAGTLSDTNRTSMSPLSSEWERKNALSYEQIMLSSTIEDWTQVIFNFEVLSAPGAEKLEVTGEPDKIKPLTKEGKGKKTKIKKNVKAQALWPRIYAIQVLMPRHAFDIYMSEVNLDAVSTDVIDQEIIEKNWMRRINPTQTRLRSVLESCRMSVADCTRLEIGQVLPLPGASLGAIKIEAEFGDKRQVILQGAMGVHKSHKAIRLKSNLDTAFTDNISV